MANTTGYTSTTKPTTEVVEGADYCSHTSATDYSKMVGYYYERDSFGYVGVYVVCEPCRAKAKAQEDEHLEPCADCNMSHPKKNTRQWRWYDFYAPQGDEPRIVCNGCWELPKHQTRMANDKLDYEMEFGHSDEPDWDHPDDDEEQPLDDEDDFQEPEHEEQPSVLFDVQFYRDRFYNLLGTTPTEYQHWSKCIQRVRVIAK